MKRSIRGLSCAMVMLLGTASIAGCMGKSSPNSIRFWVYGTTEQVAAYRALGDEFNKTYGAEHGIEVDITLKSKDAFQSSIETLAFSSSAPDVFMLEDDPFKSYVVGGYAVPLDEYIDAIPDISIDDIRPSIENRYHFDKATNTSKASDPLYALPLSSLPTALYYNLSKFEEAGIFVISVDEKDLDAWNAGEIPDNNGVYKKDMRNVNNLTLDGITVPAKGYFRSQRPYHYEGTHTETWVLPASDEVLVFNNRIPMNWDEVEDLAQLFTGYLNPKDGNTSNTVTKYGTTYGYFTEWWFNYGWSVGGDCLLDLTGSGEWNFSLLDPNPNYIVVGDSYTGKKTGTVYAKGDSVKFLDKMDIRDGETLLPDDVGGYTHADGTPSTVNDDVKAAAENGTLAEVPSTREAFKRYLKLGASEKQQSIEGEAGINVSPNPDKFPRTELSMRSFWSGEIAMIAQTSVWLYDLADQAAQRNFKWDVAPLAVYKEYEDPDDPQNDNVVVTGKPSGHSNAYSMALCAGSQKKEKAAAFIKWAASIDGQRILAQGGFFPNQSALVDEIVLKGNVAPQNIGTFSEALDYQRAGDWWYMPDVAWVQAWCVDLNSYVRNGLRTFDEWYKPAIAATNAKLVEYKKYLN